MKNQEDIFTNEQIRGSGTKGENKTPSHYQAYSQRVGLETWDGGVPGFLELNEHHCCPSNGTHMRFDQRMDLNESFGI